jgi:hypothetical protein
MRSFSVINYGTAGIFMGVKGGRRVNLTTSSPSMSPLFRKCEIFDVTVWYRDRLISLFLQFPVSNDHVIKVCEGTVLPTSDLSAILNEWSASQADCILLHIRQTPASALGPMAVIPESFQENVGIAFWNIPQLLPFILFRINHLELSFAIQRWDSSAVEACR